jgi:hypothetical protein
MQHSKYVHVWEDERTQVINNNHETKYHFNVRTLNSPPSEVDLLPSNNTRAEVGQRRKWTRRLSDSWAIDMSQWVLLLHALVAILTILFYFDGRALAEWRSDLNINTMLAVLATAMKGCVLLATTLALGQCKWQWYSDRIRPLYHFQALDDPSRGPLGARRLLTNSHFLASLASMGALITSTSLAADAFVQASASQVFLVTHFPGASVSVCHYYGLLGTLQGPDPLLQGALLHWPTPLSKCQLRLLPH